MTDEQITQLKKELAIATEAVVRTTVNGKIDTLGKKFDEYVVEDLKWKSEMEPVKEGLHFIQSLNKLVKWLGFPALGALVAYWFMK